jgi:hypothetical protein
VELFELMRRDSLLYEKSVRGIARERGVHRRQVRQALESDRDQPTLESQHRR